MVGVSLKVLLHALRENGECILGDGNDLCIKSLETAMALTDLAEEIYYDASGLDENVIANEQYLVSGELIEKIDELLSRLVDDEA